MTRESRWLTWMVRWLSGQEVAAGGRVPWWMGIAWWCEGKDAAVCLPLGLHWIAGGARAGWQACRVAVWPAELDHAYERGRRIEREAQATARASLLQRLSDAHTEREAAFKAGRSAGYTAGWVAAFESIERDLCGPKPRPLSTLPDQEVQP